MVTVPVVILAVLLMLLTAASVTDIKERIIPNIIPALVVALFFIAIVLWPEFRADWPWRIAAFAVAFAVGFILFVAGIMGGGDVKLFAALALFHTLGSLAVLALAMSIAGAGIALLFAAYDFVMLRRKNTGAQNPLSQDLRQAMKTRIPYGVAIFAGQVWVMAMAS